MQSGIAAHATRPDSMAAPVTGSTSPSPEWPQMGASRSGRFMPPGLAKLPVTRYSRRCSQLFSVEWGAILDAKVLLGGQRAGSAHRACRGPQLGLVDAALASAVGDVGARDERPQLVPAVQCSARNFSSVSPSSTMIASSAASAQASVPGRTRRWWSAIAAVSDTPRVITTSLRSSSLRSC